MKIMVVSLVCVLLSSTVVAQDFDEYLKERRLAYEEYSKSKSENLRKLAEDWEIYSQVSSEDYERYVEYEQAEYEAYRQQITARWGKKNFAADEAKRIVEYSEDLQYRTDVNLETGEVKVEVLASLGESLDVVSLKLKAAVKEFVQLKLDVDDYGLSEDASVQEVIERILETVKKESEIVETDEGEKQIVRLNVQLAENHISTRAAEFKDIIHTNSQRFSIDEPLIYAVIEQESAFNPRARSSAPAYGLMQLVPRSGGREAFRHVHGRDLIPLPLYLYLPENNVELGTGYLHKLMTVTFAGVKNEDSRMLCAIAAYNTGPGNVSKAITGNTSVSKAIPLINAMTYEKLYDRLRKKLPYAETRDYIQSVISKREKYIR